MYEEGSRGFRKSTHTGGEHYNENKINIIKGDLRPGKSVSRNRDVYETSNCESMKKEKGILEG